MHDGTSCTLHIASVAVRMFILFVRWHLSAFHACNIELRRMLLAFAVHQVERHHLLHTPCTGVAQHCKVVPFQVLHAYKAGTANGYRDKSLAMQHAGHHHADSIVLATPLCSYMQAIEFIL